MGNEGSVPQQGGEEEFENQARAPPSSSNPPLPATSQSQSSKGGSRLVNAFRRGNNNSNHNHNNNNNLNSEAIASYPTPNYSMDNGSGNGNGNDELLMDPQPQQPQQLYYHPQQAPPQNIYQMQQQSQQSPPQMTPNQYYSQQQQQPPQYAMQQQGESQVLYANSSLASSSTTNANTNTNTNTTANTSVKKAMNFRTAAGSNIMNKMKNLTLARKQQQQQQQQQQQGGSAKEVNDWETKWDEDDDSEEDEDERVLVNEQHQQQQQQQQQQVEKRSPSQQPLHPQMRLAMDAGLGTPIAEPPPYLVTAVTPDSIPQQQQQQLEVEDGVEWDTGVVQHGKPDVQMFLPLLRVLGKGSFGKVVLVQKRTGKERGALFAMKILRKSHLVRRRQIERTRTERKVLSVVNHPFIMKLHYAFQSPDKLYLVLDYCPGGELFFHLSRFRRFPERVARFYAAELLLALGHLHKRGIIYRDLKPENVLLDAEGHVKLGDFGLAKAGIKQSCEGATSMCGTPEYMAPEVLAQQGHGFCVDYWGLGMLVYEMMTGLPPWYTTDRAKLFRRLRSAPLDIPSYFSQSSATCVSALLERNPRRRLGVTGVRAAMEHEFFRSISWRALYGRRVEAPIRPCEGWSPPEAVSEDQQQDPAAVSSSSQTTTTTILDYDNLNLDAATANFDNTFTRMPVESDHENANDGEDDEGDLDELHEDTFIGFTFDDNDRDEMVAVQAAAVQAAARQRTQHYNNNPNTTTTTNGSTRQID